MPDSLSSTILTTMATSAVALLTLLIAKDQKISDLRQTWIDSLRSDLANIVAHSTNFRSAQSENANWKDYQDALVGVNFASTTAKLRLNPKEEPSKKLLQLLDEHMALFQEGKPVPPMTDINRIESALVATAQEVLKKEWKRVKAGELRFRLAMYLSGSTLIFASISLMWRSEWFQSIINHAAK